MCLAVSLHRDILDTVVAQTDTKEDVEQLELVVLLHLPRSEEAAGVEAGGRGGEVGREGGGRPRQETQEEQGEP